MKAGVTITMSLSVLTLRGLRQKGSIQIDKVMGFGIFWCFFRDTKMGLKSKPS